VGQSADDDIERFVDLLNAARQARVRIHSFSQRLGFNETATYRIQKAGVPRRANAVRGRCFKLEFTSEAMRKQMGVESANFGVLTDSILINADTGFHAAASHISTCRASGGAKACA
jgi:2-keto-4-pentenoate hydratase